MNTRIIPYGPSGWDEKVRILQELIRERTGPPFLYDDVLLLVPSARLRRTYSRLILDIAERSLGARALVPPDILTLHQFLQRLFARAGGPRLIDENSRLVLLEGIVKEGLGVTGGITGAPEIIAPSLASVAAEAIESLSVAGVAPEQLSAAIAGSPFADRPQVRVLLGAYARYQQVLAEQELVDPAGMLAWMADRFDPAWLRQYRRVIVDGLHDANDLQARLLRSIAGRENCLFLIDAPGPDAVRNAGLHHPLRLVKEFAGRVGLMLGEAPVPLSDEEAFLAAALFSDKPFPESARRAPEAFTGDIRVLSAVSMREEVSLIAGEVKRSLQRGTPPDTVLVAFPSLDEYGPLAEELFRDKGIPYNRALGRQLSASPVATAVISLLAAVRDDYAGTALLRVLSSPFLRFAELPAAAPALDRLMRERRIVDGREKWLAALGSRDDAADGPGLPGAALRDLFSALEPFGVPDALPLSEWMDRLQDLIAWSGLAPRVDLIKGPLNMNLQALRMLNGTIASLSQAGRLFPAYRYTFTEWFFLLRKTFMHARFQVPPDDEGGVQILGLEESAGHAWREIHLGGLIDGAFPQRPAQNIFLPEATLETLGVRTLERSRTNAAYHFYRLLLSSPKVTLTWPENQGDKPVVPSPFLVELSPLRLAGCLNRGVEQATGIQSSLKIGDAQSVPELARAIAVAGDVPGVASLLDAEHEGLSAIRSALGSLPRKAGPAVPPPARREFSVTELDQYLACPYDYYVTYILGIEPLEEVSEDISPLDRGSRVHEILRQFYDLWEGPVTTDDRERARSLLLSLADSAFRRESDTFRNRREKARFTGVVAERFLDAEAAYWTQGFRPLHLERKIERFPLVLSDGTSVELRAKIDRIDVDAQGDFIIVDYKTGSYPQPKKGLEQEIFQLPLYAVMARERLAAGSASPLRDPIALAYYDLAGRVAPGARDVVLYDREARNDHPAAKPQSSPKSAEEFRQILEMSREKARKAVEGILAGEFAPGPQDENRCRFCPQDVLCRMS